MAIYDLPKVLDLVFETTHQKSIYIGYSMGTTISYVYSSTFPKQASRLLKGMISLAPIAYLNDLKTILRYGAPFWPVIEVNVILHTLSFLIICSFTVSAAGKIHLEW